MMHYESSVPDSGYGRMTIIYSSSPLVQVDEMFAQKPNQQGLRKDIHSSSCHLFWCRISLAHHAWNQYYTI